MRKASGFILLIGIAALVGWDIFVAVDTTADDDTFSRIIADYASEYPAIPLFAGMLMSHFFWPTKKQKLSKIQSLGLVGGIVGLVQAVDFAGILPNVHPMFYFVPGLFLGCCVWRQKSK